MQAMVLIMTSVIVVKVIGTDLRSQIIDQPGDVPPVCVCMAYIDEHFVASVPAYIRELLLVQQHIFLQDRACILDIDRAADSTEKFTQLQVVFMRIVQHPVLFVRIHPAIVQMHGEMSAVKDPGILESPTDMPHCLLILRRAPCRGVLRAENRAVESDLMLLQNIEIVPQRLLELRQIKHRQDFESNPVSISLRIVTYPGE